MKKLVAGLFTALALTLGLVTVAGTAPASATNYAPTPPPPAPAASVKAVAGKPVHIKIASGVIGGSAASGTATIKIKKGPKGLAKKLKKAFKKGFKGGSLTLPKKKFKKPGKYTLQVTIGGVTHTVKVKIKKKK